MANHKSALKRMRQNQIRAQRNASFRTQLKTTTKKVLAQVKEKNKERAEELLKEATKTISKISSKGVLHKRAASRKIASLSRKVHQISAPA